MKAFDLTLSRRRFLINTGLISAGLIVGEQVWDELERLAPKRLWTGIDPNYFNQFGILKLNNAWKVGTPMYTDSRVEVISINQLKREVTVRFKH